MRNEQKKSYSFLGLLSHQVLRRKPGHPTNAEEIKPSFPSDQNDLAIAIPATHILTWFKDQFQKNEELTWQRNPEDQIKGRTVIQYGPLQFSLKTAQGKDIWDVGGADGSGVGGEAFGRNDFELSSSEEVLVMDITLNPLFDQASSLPLERPQLHLWRNWLLDRKKVRALFLRNSQERRLLKIQSLEQFFTFWWRDKFEPLVIRTNSRNTQSDEEILLHSAREVAKAAQMNRDQLTNNEIDLQSWFSMIRDYAIMAENGLTTTQDIASLLTGPNDPYWKKFYELNFDAAVDLETKIQKLIEQQKKWAG